MSQRRVPVRAEFQVSDSSGDVHTFYKITNMIQYSSLGAQSWRPGLAEFRTAEGRRVNALDDGRFQVVDTGEIFEPVDPS